MMRFNYAKSELMGDEQLIIYGNSESKFVPYIIDTVACNPQLNIIQPMYKETDGRITYLYDIANMISLKEFLQNHEISVAVVCRILKGFAFSILNSKDYLVDMDKFVLLSELIFIQDSVEKVKLLVVPSDKSVFEDTQQAFKELVVDIVFNLAVYSDDGGGFIENLLNLLKKGFSIDKLLELCMAYESINDAKEVSGEAQFEVPECTTSGEELTELSPQEAVRELFDEKKEPTRNGGNTARFYIISAILIIFIFMIPTAWLAEDNLNSLFGFSTKEVLLGVMFTAVCGKYVVGVVRKRG